MLEKKEYTMNYKDEKVIYNGNEYDARDVVKTDVGVLLFNQANIDAIKKQLKEPHKAGIGMFVRNHPTPNVVIKKESAEICAKMLID